MSKGGAKVLLETIRPRGQTVEIYYMMVPKLFYEVTHLGL